jgi:hypothetical protein
MRRTFLLAVLGAAALGAALLFARRGHTDASGQPDSNGPVSLPISQVVLFNSGVGYFQREGQVEGDAHVDLSFPAGDINDLLKSLIVQDASGGKVGEVSYDSFDPVDRTLRSFALDLTGNPSVAQILNQARGEKIEIVRQQHGSEPLTLSGIIVGMEPRPQANNGQQLNLLTADGLRGIALAHIQKVRFLNPTLDGEFRRALDVLARTRDVQKKSVRVHFTGKGKRTVRVGYVVERPIWKTSYRLSVGQNGKPHLQGWALVENTSDDDWSNVRMVLVTGRPISFRMNLYQPLYVPRPLVEPELFASLRPPVYSGDMTDAPSPVRRQPVGREKRFNFELHGVPWKKVMEWLSEQTGLPFVSSYTPTGLVTFSPPLDPSGRPRQLTVPEMLDALNEVLQSDRNNNYVILRRPSSLTLHPADTKIPPELLSEIRPENLEQLGKSEIVKMRIQLTTLDASELAKTVQKLLGPYGEAVALGSANQLYLQDRAGTLMDIRDMIHQIEKKAMGGDQASTLTHQCKWIRATAAAETLRSTLGDPNSLIRSALAEQMRSGFGGPGGSAQASNSRVRPHTVTADEGTNTVIVSGPPDKVALAKYVLAKIDKQQSPEHQPILIGPPTFKQYAVANGNAEALAKTLREVFKTSTSLRIEVAGNTLLVYATPEDHFLIQKQLNGGGMGGKVTALELILIDRADAQSVANTINKMYAVDVKGGAPFVEADVGRNAVIFKGTAEQRKEVQEILRVLESGGEPSLDGFAVNRKLSRSELIQLSQAGFKLLATPEDIGDSYRYRIDQKITVSRQKSVMLPLVNQPVSGAKVSIFNPAIHAKFPMLGLRLKNTTGHPLMQGPITVYEESVYTGDTRILDLQPNEERLVSYAIDLGTEVVSTTSSRPGPEMTFRIGGDNLTAHYKLRQTRTYTIKNRSAQDRTVLIEQPIRADWKLVADTKTVEKSREDYRFPVKVHAGKTVTYEVHEEQDQADPVSLTAGDKDTPPRYAVAQGIEVRQMTQTTPEELRSIQVVKGVVEARYHQQETTSYLIQNNSGEERTFTVDHLIRPDWRLIGPGGKVERGLGVHRVVARVGQGKSATITVSQEHDKPFKNQRLGELDELKLREFLSARATPAAVRSAVERVLSFRCELGNDGRLLKELQARHKELSDDQARVRENLTILSKDSATYKRFLDKFEKQESRIEEMQAQIRQVQATMESRRNSNEEYLNALTVS